MNLTTFSIRQLCWIICSDEVLRLGLETTFTSLSIGLEGFRSRLTRRLQVSVTSQLSWNCQYCKDMAL